MHTKILELMKEKFPELNLPEIPEGFQLNLSFSITRHVAEPKYQTIKWVHLSYNSDTGELIYTPWVDGYTYAQSEKITLGDMAAKIDWIKSTGTVTVHGAINLIVAPVTL